MFKNYLKGIEGIANYPLFSLVVFFSFFIVLTIWLIRTDKRRLEEISKLPFDKSDLNNSSNN